MKKQKKTIVLLLVLMLVVVGLSGCTEQSDTANDTSDLLKISIIDFDVKTIWEKYENFETTIFTEDGFYHNIPAGISDYTIKYVVDFTVQNYGDEMTGSFSIRVIFCDQNNNELFSKSKTDYSLPSSYSKTYSVESAKEQAMIKNEYFDFVEKVKFEIIDMSIQ